MIISDLSQVPDNLKQVIEQNPFANQLRDLRGDLSNYQSYLNDAQTNIENYKRAVVNEKLNKQTYFSKVMVLTKQLNTLQKSADAAVLDYSLEFLKPERVEKFFDSIGMKFISFSFRHNADEASLRFVRPARMIGCLPVQPLIVRINYTNNNGVLTFKKANCFTDINTSEGHNTHPHIATDGEGTVCLGNYIDILNEQSVPLIIESYQDHVILLDQLLSTYNPDSPYRRLDEIIMDAIKRKMSFLGREILADNDHRAITLVHSKLNQARSAYPVKDLITRPLYEEYYDMMSKVKMIDIIEDIEAWIHMLTHDGDNSDSWEYIQRMETTLKAIFSDFTFTDLEDHDRYEDDGDYRYIYEDDFDELKKEWLKTIAEIRESDDINETLVKFKGFENLDDVLPLPTLQQAVSESTESVQPRQEIPMPASSNYYTPVPTTSEPFTF